MTQPNLASPLAEPPRRPPELEDWLNARLYHPLSWRLALRLAATPVTPNMVSAAGALAIMAAALAYSLPGWPLSVAAGLALHMGWHVLDGADGDLARMTGRSSPQGELFDGICDYAGHIVLYLALGAIAAAQIGGWGWALMGAAGVSHIVQAAHYEGTRRSYQMVAYGTAWLGTAAPAAGADARRHPVAALYLGLTGMIVPCGAALSAAMQDPARRDALRDALRARAPALLGRMSLISSNYRTLAVGAAMLAGQPQWYFAVEVTALNCVLAASWWRVRREFGQALDHAAPSSTRR